MTGVQTCALPICSGEMFGPKAPASIMNKITTVIAAAFLVLSLILAIMSGLGNDSVMRKANILSQQLPAEATQAPVNMPAQGNSPVIPSNTPAE